MIKHCAQPICICLSLPRTHTHTHKHIWVYEYTLRSSHLHLSLSLFHTHTHTHTRTHLRLQLHALPICISTCRYDIVVYHYALYPFVFQHADMFLYNIVTLSVSLTHTHAQTHLSVWLRTLPTYFPPCNNDSIQFVNRIAKSPPP